MSTIYADILDTLRANRPAALATVIRARGSAPRHEAAKMLILDDGTIQGTIGGGEMESRVIAAAQQVIQSGQAEIVRYALADPASGDPGVCGGEVEIFLEPLLPPPLLVVIGAGHVGRALAYLAKWLGFRVAVLDDRPGMAVAEAFPEADRVLSGPLVESLNQVGITGQTYVVAVNRGYRLDVEVLPVLLTSPAAYIGIMGSQRRWLTTVAEVRELGIREEQLARVHAPVGLELNAETPEEIAVSIMAEVIMIQRQGTGQPMSAGRREKRVESRD